MLYALGAIRNVGLEAMEHRGRRCARRAGRSATSSTSSSGSIREQVNKRALREPGPGRRLRQPSTPTAPRSFDRGRRPDRPTARAWRPSAPRRQVSLFGGDQAGGRAPAPAQASSPGPGPSSWTRNWPPSASTCPATRWTTWSRRCAASAPTCSPTPSPQAEAGAEAFRMAGVVRRRQERASAAAGEKFAFVTLSDPTGEYEVLFPPEALRKCRDAAGAGHGGADPGARQGHGRRGALLRRRRRAGRQGDRGRASRACASTSRRAVAEIEALKTRLDGRRPSAGRRDHPDRRRWTAAARSR